MCTQVLCCLIIEYCVMLRNKMSEMEGALEFNHLVQQ